MFLSFNPAITQGCIFPRWHPENSTFNFYANDPNSISDSEIYDFLRDRLTGAPIAENGTPHAWKFDAATNSKSHFSVKYWLGLYKVMNEIFTVMNANDIQPAIQAATIPEHSRKLMRSVLSTEIIFWGSKQGAYAKDTKRLVYFWRKYFVPMLEKSAARILFLVGGDTQEAFHDIICPNGGIYTPVELVNKYGEKIITAAIYHLSYDSSKNYDDAVNLLANTNCDAVRNAWTQIKYLYQL